jgi:hypothetical protein
MWIRFLSVFIGFHYFLLSYYITNPANQKVSICSVYSTDKYLIKTQISEITLNNPGNLVICIQQILQIKNKHT